MDKTDNQLPEHVVKLIDRLKETLTNLTSLDRFTPAEVDREDFLIAVRDYVQEMEGFQQTYGPESVGPGSNRIISAYKTYKQLVQSGAEDARTKAFYDLLGFTTDVAFRYKGRKSSTLVSEFTARSIKNAVVGISTNSTRYKLLISPLVKWVNKAYLTNDQVRDGLKDLVLADAKAVDKLTKLVQNPALNMNTNIRHRYALYVAAHKVERSQEPTQD